MIGRSSASTLLMTSTWIVSGIDAQMLRRQIAEQGRRRCLIRRPALHFHGD